MIPLEGAELNSLKELDSDYTRQSRIDSEGALWVCHNQGLQIFPNSNSAASAISSRMKNIPTWDVAFYTYKKKSYTAVISYDSGLYIFNKQGQLNKRISLNKTRALHWVKNNLYCLSANGVFQINNNDTFRITPACQANEQITSFFHWNGFYYACAYPSNKWLQFKENERAPFIKWNDQAPWPITHSVFSHETTDSFLYLGSEGSYYVIDRNNQSTRFNLGRNKEANWTVWSIENCDGQIYLSLGNTHKLERGAIVKHNPFIENIKLSSASKDPFIWGLTYDTTHHVLWASSLGKGCYALISPNEFHQIPFGNIYCKQGWVCIFNEQRLYFKNLSHPTWTNIDFADVILDIQISANRLFVLTKDWLYEWNQARNSFQRYLNVEEYRFNKLISAGFLLILHRPYGEWSSIDIRSQKFEKWPKSSKQTAQFFESQEFVITQEFNGSLHLIDLENHQSVLLGDLEINAQTPIAISNNLMIVQVGKKWNVYQYSIGQLKFLFTLNVRDFILPDQEFKLFGTSRGFWVLSNSHLYQIIVSMNGSVQIAGQQYVGQLSHHSIQTASVDMFGLWYYQSGVWKCLPPPKNFSERQTNGFSIGYQNGKTEFITGEYLTLQTLNDFNIQFTHADYWIHYHSLLSVSLKNNRDQFIHRQIRSGQQGNWIPGVPSGDYALYLYQQAGSSLTFVHAQPRQVALVIAIAIILIFVSTVVYFRNLSKSTESDLLLLRWKTLKSNLNPHFLHNSMSLIQSLIAQNENKKAIEVTGKIAGINRLFLETNLQEVSTLEKELEFCRNYIQIESLRFSNKKFKFTESIDPAVNLKEWLVPPLLLQPVIENAIKHGLLLEPTSGELVLRINHILNTNTLEVKISNTGPGPAFKRTHGTKMGSELIRERLEHFNRMFQDKFKAEVDSGFDANQENQYVFTMYLVKL